MDEQLRRDDVIERELSRALRARAAAAGGEPHLDAETAAAWMERRLDTTAAQAAEVHLASCGDCQAMMATLARITPEPEPVAGRWWSRLRTPWLVPATAAVALALVIWVSQAQRPAPPAQPEAMQARAEPPEPLPETRPSMPLTEPSSSQAAVTTPAPTLEQPAPEQLRKGVAGRVQLEAATGAEPAAPPPPVAPSPAAADRADAEAKVAAAPQVGNLSDAERSAAARERAATPTPPDAGAAAPAPTRQEAAANTSPRVPAESARFSALQRAVDLNVIAPDGGARWRRAGTALEFAARANAPFVAATLPVDTSLLAAGVSPGGNVCWLVGRSGAVLITTDGTRFSRVSAPAPADLISVSATDARNATVAAADGRRFRTTDQGATWERLPQ